MVATTIAIVVIRHIWTSFRKECVPSSKFCVERWLSVGYGFLHAAPSQAFDGSLKARWSGRFLFFTDATRDILFKRMPTKHPEACGSPQTRDILVRACVHVLLM